MKFSEIQQYFIKHIRKILNKSGLRRRRTIVFASPVGFHLQHLLPIIDELVDNEKIELIIVETSDWKQISHPEKCKSISQKDFMKKRWCFYDLIFGTDFSSIPWWFNSGLRVALLHGAGPKVGFFEDLANGTYDVVYSPGPYIKEFEENIIIDTAGKNTKLLPVGLPVTDIIYEKKSFSITVSDTNKPIILYAPSWHLEPSYVAMDEAFIRELSSQDKYHIIVRPHPNLLIPEKCNGKDWKALLYSYENENFKIPLEGSIYQYLPMAAAIISDYSSVIYEYLLFDRPGFLYVSRDVMHGVFSFRVIDPDSEAIVEPLCAAFETIDDPKKLLEILDNDITNPAIRLRERHALMNDTFFNIGCATKAAAEETIRLLEFN